MRLAVVAVASFGLVPSVATADTLDLGYDAAIEVRGDTGGDRLLVGSLRGTAAYMASLGRRMQLDAEASAAVTRVQGTVDATGATTHAALSVGASPLPPGNKNLDRLTVFPMTFDVAHDGDLRALPTLSDRPDVRRAPYAWERITLATRAVHHEYAVDEPDRRETGVIHWGSVRTSLALADQDDARRVDAISTIALADLEARWPTPATLELLAFERRASRVASGRTATMDLLYFFRVQMPTTSGATYEISWGTVLDAEDTGPRENVIDHREPQFVALGLGAEHDDAGGGIQFYRRIPYVTMDGRAMFDERAWVEAWFRAHEVRWQGRAFVAHSRRAAGAFGNGTWTGGVEVAADRQVGPFDVGARVEAGRSFYAALDGADPAPGFAARGGLTVRRAATRRWFY